MWELDHKESWAPKNWCFWTVVLEDSSESLGLQGDPRLSNTSATRCKELTHWKRPRCWERLSAGGEGDDRWDDWMASLTQWAWVWASSGSWWWTGRPGVPQSMGLQRVRHEWVTELNGWLRTTMALRSDCDRALKSLTYLHSSEKNFASPWNRATKTYETILSSMTGV